MPNYNHKTVALVCPKRSTKDGTISDPFLLTFIGALADALFKQDYQLLITTWTGDNHNWYTELIQSGRATAIVVFGHSDFTESIARLARTPAPFVVWGSTAITSDYCIVGSNNRQGGYLATKHLLELGRKKIAFLGDYYMMEVDQRWQGYKDALADHGIAYNESLVARTMPYDYATFDALYKQIVAKGLEFDGLFASTDIIANFALRILRKLNMKVPQDVSVVGFDNSTLAQLTEPPLTSVNQDINFGARALAEQLVKAIEGNEVASVALPVNLVERSSSRPTIPNQGLIKLNQAGIVQDIDLGGEKLLGYQRNEIIGRHIETIIPARRESDSFDWKKFTAPDNDVPIHEHIVNTNQKAPLSVVFYLAPNQPFSDIAQTEEISVILSANPEKLAADTPFKASQTDQHIETNSRLAELAATAAKLERLAYRDGLTDVANRRHFDKALTEAFERAKHEGSHLTLVMIDIDYFKRYNDNHGHIAGDQALKSVAQSLAKEFSADGQLVARFGGEEFAVILPEVESKAAQSLVEQALTAIRTLNIPHRGSEISDTLTLSAGFSSLAPTTGQNAEMLLWASDQGLYEAKRNGRDRAIYNEVSKTAPKSLAR